MIEIKQVKAEEWHDSWRGTPLFHCVELSNDVWVANVDGNLVCVWGLITPSLLSDKAYLWLHTFSDLPLLTFVRRSREVIAEMLKRHPNIVGQCLNDNYKARRWLKWLGAEFSHNYGGMSTWLIQRR